MEILYQCVRTSYTWGWNAITTLCVAALLVWLGIVIIDKVYKKSYDSGTRFFAICAFIVIIFIGILSSMFSEKIPYNVYKVTIDENVVSYTEFLEQYEIIEQEGKIYTIKERNNG